MGSATIRGAILPSPPKEMRVASLAPVPTAATRAKVQEDYGRLPMHFEANRGQADPQVQFLARGPGYTLFLTPTEAMLVLRKPHQGSLAPAPGERERVRGPTPAAAEPSGAAVVRMQLVGANPKPQVTGLDELPGKVNYFLGNDPTKWRTNVPAYAKVHYKDIYPGVDLVYYGNQRQLEYDFIIAPGADPRSIRLALEGAAKPEIDAQGDLVLHTPDGDLRLHRPRIYQEVNGARHEIAGSFVFNLQSEIRNLQSPVVGFQVAAYDPSEALVIDPVLSYSTYLGGSGSDGAAAIAVDAAGNAYITGDTSIPYPGWPCDFPTTPGAFDRTCRVTASFVTKLNPAGSALIYSTFLGGSTSQSARGIAVDVAGNAYVTGEAYSGFPTTPGAFQPTFGGGSIYGGDAFVTKLNPAGSALIYSTYLGGRDGDRGLGMAVDAAGNAYVTGYTYSTNFPTTPAAFSPMYNGGSEAFVTKLNPTGSALVYSTFLGGPIDDYGWAIAVDAAGNAYVTGGAGWGFPTTPGAFQPATDDYAAFVTKLNAAGSALVYSTFLGGSGIDFGRAIAVDSSGNPYVTGDTQSADFPTTLGAFQPTSVGGQQGFVTKLNPTGSALVYSTYLGGSGAAERGSGIAVDTAGKAYVTGETSSPDFPTTPDAFQPSFGGACDAFFTTLNPDGSALAYSTFLGGSTCDRASGIAVDRAGNAYVTGGAGSGFPTTPGAFQGTYRGQGDAFVAKICLRSGASGFDYPIGPPYVSLGSRVTEAIDGDGWYVAQEFGEPNPEFGGRKHLGEDWNSERGASDDLGKPVYAAATGTVIYAQDAETGWNGVIIIEHQGNFVLPDGRSVTQVWTMYAHLDVATINDWVRVGDCVAKNRQVGVIGPTPEGSTGPHLHFEIRESNPPDLVGPAYSFDTTGWVDPSDFIDQNQGLRVSPELTLGLNKVTFRRGEQLILTASVTPGPTPVTADVYVAVQLPDGTLLFLRGDGRITSDLQPIVRSWPASLFAGQIFAYTFGGGEPVGNYAWLAAFTQPGTLNFIGGIVQAPFSFSP